MTTRHRVLVISVCLLAGVTAGAAARPAWTEDPPPLSDFDFVDPARWTAGAPASPGTAQTLNERGFEAYQEGRLYEAAQIWKAALSMDPDNPWANYNYASALALFARGFPGFDASGEDLPNAAWDREDFFDYRNAIINHLKRSILLRPERRLRLLEDEDFDGIRRLVEYENLLMGPDPDPERVLEMAPRWYSLQPGAYLPSDNFEFFPDGRMEFRWDKSRMTWFPELFDGDEDRSFSGRWRIENQTVVVETDDGGIIRLRFDHRYDDLGFIDRRILLYGTGRFGDREAHYWEGQDG